MRRTTAESLLSFAMLLVVLIAVAGLSMVWFPPRDHSDATAWRCECSCAWRQP